MRGPTIRKMQKCEVLARLKARYCNCPPHGRGHREGKLGVVEDGALVNLVLVDGAGRNAWADKRLLVALSGLTEGGRDVGY
jgi:hypothetical protein